MITRVFLLMALVAVGFVVTLSPRAPDPPPDSDYSLSDTPTFADAFRQHLLTVQAAADALVELGETRERNLLVVRQGQSAMNEALDSTDAWLSQQNAHEDDDAVATYRAGATLIRQSMADAQSAFFRFDWDSVTAANVTLRTGTNQIREAITQIGASEMN